MLTSRGVNSNQKSIIDGLGDKHETSKKVVYINT